MQVMQPEKINTILCSKLCHPSYYLKRKISGRTTLIHDHSIFMNTTYHHATENDIERAKLHIKVVKQYHQRYTKNKNKMYDRYTLSKKNVNFNI